MITQVAASFRCLPTGLCMEKITSKSNNLIKQAVKLSASGAARRKEGRFLLEGVRLCCDVFHSSVCPETVLITESCLDAHRAALAPLLAQSAAQYLITPELAAKMADTVHPQGVFCICAMRQNQIELRQDGRYVVLDHLQDPSNLGAIARTAEALGIDGVLTGGGVDFYNPKAMRASMGSLLRLPVLSCDGLEQTLLQLKQMGVRLVATVPDRTAASLTTLNLGRGTAAIIGNEANGVSPALLALADVKATIPMEGRAESLNAATAAAITIWEMMRGNGM